MDINLDELPRPLWNWRRKSPPNPRLINTASKKFTARRRLQEMMNELADIEKEFSLDHAS